MNKNKGGKACNDPFQELSGYFSLKFPDKLLLDDVFAAFGRFSVNEVYVFFFFYPYGPFRLISLPPIFILKIVINIILHSC